MAFTLLDGKSLSQVIQEHIRERIKERVALHLDAPKLAVVLIGENSASHLYVKNKRLACKKVGMQSLNFDLPANISQDDLLKIIHSLNQDDTVNGILVQLPLPNQINSHYVLDQIDPRKDVDGFHPLNLGLLTQGRPFLRPCTPLGCMRLLQHYHIDLQGMNAVVVGASNIVGKPLFLELLMAGATVTLCHSQTQNLQKHIQSAELIVSAIGKTNVLKTEWITPGAIVIDVGINRFASGKICGDIDFETAKLRASYITPVPGGVGPMTVAMLLHNTCIAAGMKMDP